ncbi:PAAR domain-containing protein [Burkholderia gladioli]|uniref:PAAR domain-containing protein n=1 Tax=Burkholderia gladioli TaxID=28095 RepID=A0AB38TRD4_BURGA|nr:PAAR domain-containing protein [Burkholderia gladioli]UWX70358.1 PAAR domain-containing protein [Burkholderia gladioli]
MGFAFIREGDATSHGGRVLTCDPTHTVDGKPLALIGDMAACPRCGGVFPIVKVRTELNMTFGGRAVACEGDMTACGATLIASQGTATASPTSGPSGSTSASIGAGLSVLSKPASDGPQRGRFQVLDDDTGQPVAGHPYTVTGSNGQTISGTTDADGYTSWLQADQSSSLTFERSNSSSS